MGVGNAMAAVFNRLVIFRGNPYSLNSQNGLTLVCASKGHCLQGWWSKQQLKLHHRARRAPGECGWCVTSSGHDLCVQVNGAVWSRGYQGKCHVVLCVITSASNSVCPGLSGVLMCYSCAAQAERIMEAIELYREEMAKQKEHNAICKAAGKEVKD